MTEHMRTTTKVVLIAAFIVAGVWQQLHQKAADQATYEARCAEIAANPNHPASPCATPAWPDIPLPARG